MKTNQKGVALLEATIVLPLLVLVTFTGAFTTMQVQYYLDFSHIIYEATRFGSKTDGMNIGNLTTKGFVTTDYDIEGTTSTHERVHGALKTLLEEGVDADKFFLDKAKATTTFFKADDGRYYLEVETSIPMKVLKIAPPIEISTKFRSLYFGVINNEQ